MREHLGFLETSSVAVKIAAWIFLLVGVLGGTRVLLGLVPGYERWLGIVGIALFAFLFFFFFLMAKIADLLVKIINEIKKE